MFGSVYIEKMGDFADIELNKKNIVQKNNGGHQLLKFSSLLSSRSLFVTNLKCLKHNFTQTILTVQQYHFVLIGSI